MQVIDNKKVDMTNDEHLMYQSIVKSYTSTTSRGEDFFADLFEVNDDGIIIFLKPPATRQTSFEIFLFLMSLMQNQHIRVMYKQVEDICKQIKDKIKEVDDKLNK